MASALSFTAILHLAPTEEGGLVKPLPWRSICLIDIGTRFRGQPVFCDARITLEDVQELAPGGSCTVVIEPISEDLWQHVNEGFAFTLHEGRTQKGHGSVISRREAPRGLLH